MKMFIIMAVCGFLFTSCEGMDLESIQTSPLATITSTPLASPLPEPSQTTHSPLSQTPEPTLTKADRTSLATATVPISQTIVPYPTRPSENQAAVDAARAFLAEHLEIPLANIQLYYVEPKTWSDANLGCPKPDQGHAQVITPGYRVVLKFRNQQYELHTDDEGKHVVLCEGPAVGERVPLRRARSQEEIVALARRHLAERLGISVEEIKVVSVDEERWENETLDCPRPPGHTPDRAYPGPISGYRIVLAFEAAQYEYHSGRLWLIFCGKING